MKNRSFFAKNKFLEHCSVAFRPLSKLDLHRFCIRLLLRQHEEENAKGTPFSPPFFPQIIDRPRGLDFVRPMKN